jgi:hypothetical protein
VNFGRSPILLIVALFFLLFIVLSVINRKSSTSLNDTDRAVRTTQALTRVMNAETAYFAKNGKYAGHIADLVPFAPKLAVDLTDGVVTIAVDSGEDKVYLVQVASTVLSFSRAVESGKVVAKSCLQLKSAGKPYCTRKISDVKKSLPAT